jgi:hypothetical protein
LVLGAPHQRDDEIVERVVFRATEALEVEVGAAGAITQVGYPLDDDFGALRAISDNVLGYNERYSLASDLTWAGKAPTSTSTFIDLREHRFHFEELDVICEFADALAEPPIAQHPLTKTAQRVLSRLSLPLR